MAAEWWPTIGAAVLLAAAACAAASAWLGKGPAAGQGRRLERIAAGARAAALVALAAAAALSAVREGGWSATSVRQVALDLALAVVVAYLLLAAWIKLGAAGPAVDVLAVGLVLGGLLVPPAAQAGGAAVPLPMAWILTLFGAGSVAVAGSTALLLALRAVLVRRGRRAGRLPDERGPRRADLHHFLYQAATLGALALGAAMTAGLWSTWRAAGSLTTGDPRQAWEVAATLLAAAGVWAARLGRQSGRWTALLAALAAGLAVTGLLAGVSLHRVLTF